MKKDEFVEKVNAHGLGGNVFVNTQNYTGMPYAYGCFYKDGSWTVYENGERGSHDDLLVTSSEDVAFQYLYDYLVGKR